jgi:hypothetical protein
MRASIDLSVIQDDVLYTPNEASPLCGKGTKTLANERSQKRGCPVTYVGKFPHYRGSDLRASILAGRVEYSAPKPRAVKTTRAQQRKRGRAAANAAA